MFFSFCRLYCNEVSKSKTLNELLGIGVGAFQGLANLAVNGLVLVVLYCGGSLLARQEMVPGDLMSFLVATQTIQRYSTSAGAGCYISCQLCLRTVETSVGDAVAQLLVHQTWGLKVKSSTPGQCTHVLFLGKTLYSHSCSFHPGV